MVEELSKEDYVVHNTEGDGNCLFRAISHQLYGISFGYLGQEDYHGDIRLLCMNYIKGEQAFFQNYVT
jgi:OTU domain-containing protein 5